jgi:mRNA interferase MazF
VITGDGTIGALNEVLVVLVTTTIRDLPTEVRLGTEDGMPRECVLNLDMWIPWPRASPANGSRP